ncbi:MAG: thioredoxin family protein [Fibrobacterota bacterium]
MLKKTVLAALVLMCLFCSEKDLDGKETGAENSEDKAKPALKVLPFNEAVGIAGADGKLILVKIYTDWCMWCGKMDNYTYSDSKVKKELEDNFVVVSVNPEKSDQHISIQGQRYTPNAYARHIGVRGAPATAFHRPDGKFIRLVNGYKGPDEFLKLLREIDADYGDVLD